MNGRGPTTLLRGLINHKKAMNGRGPTTLLRGLINHGVISHFTSTGMILPQWVGTFLLESTFLRPNLQLANSSGQKNVKHIPILFVGRLPYRKDGTTLSVSIGLGRMMGGGFMPHHVGPTCIFLLDAWNKFQKYSPKWWFFMVINPMMQSVKNHRENKSKSMYGIYLPTNLSPQLINFVGINISYIQSVWV